MWARGRGDDSRESQDRIRDAFTKAIATQASEPVWATIDRAMQEIPTVRKIRSKMRTVKGIPQESLAGGLGTTQSSVSKWLRGGEGALVWENMVAAVTYVEIEAKNSGAVVELAFGSLPELRRRLRYGIQAAIQCARTLETGKPENDVPNDHVIECLRELCDPKNGWTKAKLETDVDKRKQKLQAAVKCIKATFSARFGQSPAHCELEDLQAIETKWMGAWIVCQSSFPIVRSATHATSA